MKKWFFIVALLIVTLPALAQRDALIDHTDRWNLNTKFDLGYTELDGDGGYIGGLSVGGLLNDAFGVGLRGRVLLDETQTSVGAIDSMDFWYAGAYLEYVYHPENIYYWSIDLFAGAGELEGLLFSSDMIVIEPGVQLWVNITETVMFGFGASYRIVDDTDLSGLDSSDLSGAALNAFLRFTQF